MSKKEEYSTNNLDESKDVREVVKKMKYHQEQITLVRIQGKSWLKIWNDQEEETVKMFNEQINKENENILIPELKKPEIDRLSFFVYSLGPYGQFELYFRKGINTEIDPEDFKYRRILRVLSRRINSKLAKQVEDFLIEYFHYSGKLIDIDIVENNF